MRKTTLIASCVIALATLVLWAPVSQAYSTYSEGRIMQPPGSERCEPPDPGEPDEGCLESFGNCKTCHGHFRATNEENNTPYLRDEYISNTDGQPWSEIYQEVEATEPEVEIGLHDIHRHIMLDKFGSSRCDTCHFGARNERFRVYTSLSNGGGGVLDPISCVGCHGRYEDAMNDNVSLGLGAGLRQHHTKAGITECKTCHRDANPANYTPVGENVLPPYYAAGNDMFVNMPEDPCNRRGEEDFAGGRNGLDNDGDGKYDRRDPDCRPPGHGDSDSDSRGKDR